jgi:hypothetical protein
LLHPQPPGEPDGPSVSGNIYWRLDAQPAIGELLQTCASALKALGYWISPFPEGDGATFQRLGEADRYDPDRAIADFQHVFPQFNFRAIQPQELARELARLNEGVIVRCTALVPVEHLRMMREIDFDAFSIYPAVDGDGMTLEDHPWGTELCDVAGADGDPHWYPEPSIGLDQLAGLLRYPLIELEIDVPVSLIYVSGCSAPDMAPLANHVLELADSCLDIVRVHFCSHEHLAFTPGRAGRVADGMSAFYLMPGHAALRSDLHLHVADVLSVRNNWLGLELEEYEPRGIDDLASAILLRRDDRANQGVIRHAIRTIGTSFYLIVPEACFLQLVYALDALAAVEGSGTHHRRHIAALTCSWDDRDPAASRRRFQERLEEFSELYSIRNQIVHRGATFASLDRDGADAADQMSSLVWACCEHLLGWGLKSEKEVQTHVRDVLRKVDASL